jgi:hypothetical protein
MSYIYMGQADSSAAPAAASAAVVPAPAAKPEGFKIEHFKVPAVTFLAGALVGYLAGCKKG